MYSQTHTVDNHPKIGYFSDEYWNQTAGIWQHLYLRRLYHSDNIRDGSPEAGLLYWVKPQPCFVPLESPLSRLDSSVWAGLCRVTWGLCKYALTLGGIGAQKDFPWLAPVNEACLAKQTHHPPNRRHRESLRLRCWKAGSFSFNLFFVVIATPIFCQDTNSSGVPYDMVVCCDGDSFPLMSSGAGPQGAIWYLCFWNKCFTELKHQAYQKHFLTTSSFTKWLWLQNVNYTLFTKQFIVESLLLLSLQINKDDTVEYKQCCHLIFSLLMRFWSHLFRLLFGYAVHPILKRHLQKPDGYEKCLFEPNTHSI